MAKTVNEIACAKLDRRIAVLRDEIDSLERAKVLINADEPNAAPAKVRKPRGPNKRRRGMPATTSDGLGIDA